MKKKLKPRGAWQAIGMQRRRIPRGDPAKLRLMAEELKGKADSFMREADKLIAQAEELEQAGKPREDVNQAAARIVSEATKNR